MPRIISHLEPKPVFSIFEDLCAIPHGSFHTKAISDYCVAFAQRNGLECWQDALNNVVIVKPATAGYEQAETVILQGHLDMVCEKEPDSPLNMEEEGLQLAIDGDSIYAKGTTLGGDDGIAVAMALAALIDEELPHPRIEAVLTVDEEVGMLGAMGLDTTHIQGRKLLNIDSEEEGTLTVSCSGGLTVHSYIQGARQSFTGTACEISVAGGQGGHSGTEIHKGRANACLLLGQLLYALSSGTDTRLLSLSGGSKNNAIPTIASAQVLVADAASAQKIVAEANARWSKGIGRFDPEVRGQVQIGESSTADAITGEATRRMIDFLLLAPNGVFSFSPDLDGLVQSSCNLGVVCLECDVLHGVHLVRSSLAEEKHLLGQQIDCMTRLLGGHTKMEDEYPAWAYNKHSQLRQDIVEIFTQQYGHPPKVEAVHSGLECGILCGKLSGLDCISYGPDLKDIHTPRERLSIASVGRVWEMTKAFLQKAK